MANGGWGRWDTEVLPRVLRGHAPFSSLLPGSLLPWPLRGPVGGRGQQDGRAPVEPPTGRRWPERRRVEEHRWAEGSRRSRSCGMLHLLV